MAKKATYIQAKVSGGSTVESFEIVDKAARAAIAGLQASTFTVTEVSDGVEISDGNTTVTIKNGSDGKSAYESYCDTHPGMDLTESAWVASLNPPTIAPVDPYDENDNPTGNTVYYDTTTHQWVHVANTDYIYKLDVSYGSGDERNFTTPNLLFGTDAILEAVDAIMNEQPASVAVTNE